MTSVDSRSSEKVPFVSVIIINYNGKDYILDCIDSVFKTVGCKFEVILIDNGSTDHGSIMCKEKYPEIILFENKKNLAMAARNIGIDNAKGEFIVFLDADTVVEPNWIEALFDSYKIHGEGLYQGKLLEKDRHDIISGCGNMANIFGLGFARGKGTVDTGKYDEFEIISFPVGACTFSNTDTIKKIGYVDEEGLFFLMQDDLDYGWRAWLLGIPSYYEPKSIIYHIGSPVLKWSPQKFFFLERNRWICLLTLYSTKTLAKIFPLLILADIGIFFFLLAKGFGTTKIKAFFSLIKMYPSIKNRRKKMMKNRKLTDKKIIKHFVDDLDIPEAVARKDSAKVFKFIIIILNKAARKIINM